MNLCRSCGNDFASVEAFDAHRVGTHAYGYHTGLQLEPVSENGRRCLDTDELRERRWTIDAKGRWVHHRELQKRLRRGGDAVSEPAPRAGTTPQVASAARGLVGPITARTGKQTRRRMTLGQHEA